MINKDGQIIYPVEIEEFLYTNRKIAEAQVFGVPDQEHGEEVTAWIKLKEGQTASKEEIISFCEEGLDHFLVPKYVEFVQSFPITPTGKVQKFKLQQEAIRLYNL